MNKSNGWDGTYQFEGLYESNVSGSRIIEKSQDARPLDSALGKKQFQFEIMDIALPIPTLSIVTCNVRWVRINKSDNKSSFGF